MPKSSVDEDTAAAASLLLQKNGNNINIPDIFNRSAARPRSQGFRRWKETIDQFSYI